MIKMLPQLARCTVRGGLLWKLRCAVPVEQCSILTRTRVSLHPCKYVRCQAGALMTVQLSHLRKLHLLSGQKQFNVKASDDGIDDEDFELIYENRLHNYVIRCNIAMAIILCGIVGGVTFSLWYKLSNKEEVLNTNFYLGALCVVCFVGPWTFLLWRTRLNLKSMYHNPATDHYIAIVTRHFAKKTQVPLAAKEIKGNPKTFVPTLNFNDFAYYVFDADFNSGYHYNRFMGHN